MQQGDLLEMAREVVMRAKKAGAEVAETLARSSRDLSVKVRLGETEMIEEAGSCALGLRILKNGRSATTSTSDLRASGLDTLVQDALGLAELAEPDPYTTPPSPEEREESPPNLELYDEQLEPFDGHAAHELAAEAESAALKLDPRITNSEGATVSRTVGNIAFATQDGFAQQYQTSFVSLVVQPLADDTDGKKRVGFYWDAKRHLHDLIAPITIGREAAQRTLAKLGARKIPTEELPVVFSPDAGRALLGLLCNCVNGSSIYKRQSYLADEEGQVIANKLVNIIDNPLIHRGPGSRPFDGEGLRSRKNEIVVNGKLTSFLLDTYSARRLNLKSTGSATRGIGGRPSPAPTNFQLTPTDVTPESLISEIPRGLYVTSMMGFGFNAVTGDFSRGAEGFLIENGQQTMPVSEVTISLNFKDLWANIDAVGNDLDPKSSISAPTFRVKNMTVAGA